MEKSNKKILYNIFDINNNINAEININRPNTQKNALKLSINNVKNASSLNKKNNIKKHNRNDTQNLNKFNKSNYFYSYNNIINNFPSENNYNIEKRLISENDYININNPHKDSKLSHVNFSPSKISKNRNEMIYPYRNNEDQDDDDDEILTKKYNEVKKLHRLFDENIKLKNEINLLKEEIERIKNINKVNVEVINNKSSQLFEMNRNTQQLKEKMDELYRTINNNNNIISKLLEEKIYLEQELILIKKEIINKNDKLDLLSEKCRNLQIKINESNEKIITFNNKREYSKIEKNKFEDNNLLLSKSSEKNLRENQSESRRLYSEGKQMDNIKMKLNRNKSINQLNINSFDSLENNETKNKIPSTPSFKSIKSNDSIKDKNEEIIEIRKEVKDLNKNNINNEIFDIKYYQNKYLYYFNLYKEYKKNNEILEKEKEELIQKYKNDINSKIKDNKETHNNLLATFSEIKINYQYNPNEFFILCDKEYGELKWYLMKKQIDYEQDDTYDNLKWVPKIDVVDIDKFNEYSNEEENNNIELVKVIQKLEEKENIISKLTYKIEKLEKEIDDYKNNSDFSDIYDEIFIKTKPKHKNRNSKKS